MNLLGTFLLIIRNETFYVLNIESRRYIILIIVRVVNWRYPNLEGRQKNI